jgi:hypothetical protein
VGVRPVRGASGGGAVPVGGAVLRSGPSEQADGGDASVRSAAAGLLAAGPVPGASFVRGSLSRCLWPPAR